jgi:hypothetical protein
MFSWLGLEGGLDFFIFYFLKNYEDTHLVFILLYFRLKGFLNMNEKTTRIQNNKNPSTIFNSAFSLLFSLIMMTLFSLIMMTMTNDDFKFLNLHNAKEK